MIDPKFLKLVQDNGWDIVSVEKDCAIARCRANGCSMKAKLVQGAHVPKVDPEGVRNVTDRNFETWMKLREILLARQAELGLSIRETEYVCGMADDHLAKAVQDKAQRVPNIMFVIDWATGLGFDVVLRPGKLRPIVLNMIAESRDKQDRRRQMHERKAAS